MDLVFATLEPANVLAKMAFSDVFDAMRRGRQELQTDYISALDRMRVDAESMCFDFVSHSRDIQKKRISVKISPNLTPTSSSRTDI